MKTCARCAEAKPTSGWPPARNNKDGLHRFCRPCLRAYNAELRVARGPVLPAYMRAWYLRRHYDLTPDDIDRMMAQQGGQCAVCHAELAAPCIDHCHDTGRIRGLLCNSCNVALGHLGEDPERIRALASYAEGIGHALVQHPIGWASR